eukprot:NODE_1493_length_1712_cov_104.031466_g1416_i0.p1 GENE.NODE_1493_length_1712_cov_104.031466_g1416_i0~~NODE_1493_length_1712_cov_104.031466_g1416_i0.p1  ORF type:complete len:518 (-),score=97.83 NODE_1493_length_1712_cov_104.031466_g1416_i0:72-1625(-)
MKVLVAGDVEGKFDTLYARVETVNKSKAGPFDVLFCVGNFFSSSSKTGADGPKALEYIQGLAVVPLPTYFIIAGNSEVELPEEGGPIAHNIHFLGKSGVTKVCGLTVAFVSGRFDKFVQTAGMSTITAYTPRSIKDVTVAAGSSEYGRMVDFLLTAEWPKHVLSTLPQTIAFDGGSAQISQLCRNLQPRYHFAGGEGLFLQRPPFRNPETPYPTRFFGMAKVGGEGSEKHKKWLYAMSITPAAVVGLAGLKQMKAPDDITDNPFTEENMRKREEGIKRQREEDESLAPKKAKGSDTPCWFCIDKIQPDAQHLVVSHGDFTYLSLAKGGLMDNHVLIMPMEHFAGTNAIHDGVYAEIQKYRDSLTAYFASKGQYAVSYERNIWHSRPSHMNVQVFAVDNKVEATTIKDRLKAKAVARGLTFEPYEDGDRLPQQYFIFWFPKEGLVYHHKAGKGSPKFDMKFGRDAVAESIGKPQSADWRECERPVTDEKQQAALFKEGFKPFDWTTQRPSGAGATAAV